MFLEKYVRQEEYIMIRLVEWSGLFESEFNYTSSIIVPEIIGGREIKFGEFKSDFNDASSINCDKDY